MGAVARWWDGVELWATGLPFVAQVTLVLVVVAPLCALAARGLDRMVGLGTALLGRVRPERDVPTPPRGD
jgi:hypothetical protein